MQRKPLDYYFFQRHPKLQKIEERHHELISIVSTLYGGRQAYNYIIQELDKYAKKLRLGKKDMKSYEYWKETMRWLDAKYIKGLDLKA